MFLVMIIFEQAALKKIKTHKSILYYAIVWAINFRIHRRNVPTASIRAGFDTIIAGTKTPNAIGLTTIGTCIERIVAAI